MTQERVWTQEERKAAAFEIVRKRHGMAYAEGTYGDREMELLLLSDGREKIDLQCALTAALSDLREARALLTLTDSECPDWRARRDAFLSRTAPTEAS